jgi:hypothetical protein
LTEVLNVEDTSPTNVSPVAIGSPASLDCGANRSLENFGRRPRGWIGVNRPRSIEAQYAMEMSEASTLNFRHLQVVQLCDRAKVGLADAALFGEKPPDELDGVVPEPRGVRVPENGAAIVEALLAQWATEDAVVLDVT